MGYLFSQKPEVLFLRHAGLAVLHDLKTCKTASPDYSGRARPKDGDRRAPLPAFGIQKSFPGTVLKELFSRSPIL